MMGPSLMGGGGGGVVTDRNSLMTPSPLSALNDENNFLNGLQQSVAVDHESIMFNMSSSNAPTTTAYRQNSLNSHSKPPPLIATATAAAYQHQHSYEIYQNKQSNSENFLNLPSFMNDLQQQQQHHQQQHNHHHHQQQQQPNQFHQQQCGMCGKDPMVNGKTLVGCLHSFCQSCLIQSTLNGRSQIQTGINGLGSSIITCPVCSQETLIPNGGIDALMPHYSNPMLLNFANLAQNTAAQNNNAATADFSLMHTLGSFF